MARTNLEVPFSQKDEVKQLGARWDPQAKVWYVPEGMDTGPFSPWLPLSADSGLEHEPEFRIRAPSYFLVESQTGCWKCGGSTRVFAFMLPEGHEQFEFLQDEEEGFALARNLGWWERRGCRTTVSNLSGLSLAVVEQLGRYSDLYKPAHSKTAGGRYFMNHCEHCGSKQGDFFMHSEPGGAFFPITPAQASTMILREINAPFEANGSVGFTTDDFMDCMKRQDA